ncbi:MAG: hypothetical protein HQ592_07630 [Planctomycetes bacterium]|nr:hypothetical protein [Planctomycetota bacterium]
MRFDTILLSAAIAAAMIGSSFAMEGKLSVGRRAIRTGSFNIKLELTAEGEGEGEGEIYFHADSEGNGYLLKLSDKKITLGTSQAGRFSPLDEHNIGDGSVLRRGTNILLIKKRGDSIRVFLSDSPVLSASDRTFAAGAFAWRSSGDLKLSGGALREIGEIYFTDDFMRETQTVRNTTQRVADHASWTPSAGGEWYVLGPGRPETSTAVFQLCQKSRADGRGIYTAGYWFWENYIYAASVRLGTLNDLAALRFYEFDSRNYFLFECNPRSRRAELVSVRNGQRTALAGKEVGFLHNQWYRIKILIRGGRFRAYIDDVPVLDESLPGAVCGGIGLEARGREVRFDDVQVFSLRLSEEDFADDNSQALRRTVLAAESAQNITASFTKRPTMKQWATDEGAWENRGGIDWTDSVYYDGALAWSPRQNARNGAPSRGTVALLLAPETDDLKQGYRIVCSFDQTAGWRDVAAFKVGKRVAGRRQKKEPERLAIVAADGNVELRLGDEALLKEALPAGYRAFHFGRCTKGDVSEAFSLSTEKLLDYPFTRAPADWFAGGTWELRPRWTCDPKFNWFSGVNREGGAELWNKHKFEGDYTVEAYIACMLLGVFPKDYAFPINFRITVAADEMKPGRGYTCVYGFIDRPAEILRNGVSVASEASHVDATLWKDFEHARSEHVHRRWFHLKVQKKGNEIRFYVDRRLWLKFEDVRPLNGPYIAISTEKNGIMVSRVKITYEKENGKALVTR